MNYSKLINTLKSECPVYYTIWEESLVIYSGHVVVLTNEDIHSIPDIVASQCERTDKHLHMIDELFKKRTRDSALFTGITFVYGTKETNVYMARRAGYDTEYPVFLRKTYADIVGKKIGGMYGGGSSTEPMYITGLEASAFVCPVKIQEKELQRLVDTINKVYRLL